MKKMLYILPVACMIMLTGCQDFLNVNKSLDAPTTITVDQAIPTACFYAAQICYDHSEYGVYLSQALTTGSNSQTGSYPYSQGWEFLGVNRHPMWRRHFYDLGANIHKMNEIAEEQGMRNAQLIGRTIMLHSTMLTTDAFGDMPRSQAYTATSPAYDSQADIYDWMYQEADELVALYNDASWTNASNNLPMTKKMDRIYGGDMKKWGLFAKALRCRLWLRKLPNWDNTPANCQKIVNMVDEVLNDPNWQEPLYCYDGGTVEQNCPWGPSRPKINAWESRDNRLVSSMPSAFFAQAILGAYVTKKTNSGYALDMRADKMMKPSNKKKDAILYLENNLGMDVTDKQNFYPDLYAAEAASNPFTLDNGYIALMLTEELMFIKAEALYWMGDKTGAYNATKEATVKSMERYGIYEANYTTTNQKKRYNLFFEVKLPGASEFTIADLMQQKYVAMYLQPEQWTDMRRYNYSSKTNGIQYDDCYVYTVTKVHDGSGKDATAAKFTKEYSLHRPFNLYQAYWCNPEDYGQNAELSPNAWIARLNADTETETKYNKGELDRIGYYTTDASGNKILDYRILKKRMIWAYNTSGKATCSDNTPWK